MNLVCAQNNTFSNKLLSSADRVFLSGSAIIKKNDYSQQNINRYCKGQVIKKFVAYKSVEAYGYGEPALGEEVLLNKARNPQIKEKDTDWLTCNWKMSFSVAEYNRSYRKVISKFGNNVYIRETDMGPSGSNSGTAQGLDPLILEIEVNNNSNWYHRKYTIPYGSESTQSSDGSVEATLSKTLIIKRLLFKHKKL